MQAIEGRMVPSPSKIQVKGLVNTNATACRAHGEDDSDTFYVKLTELLDSSGLTLIFNVRETLLDLYLFYLEVTRRGGFHQIVQEKKWGEVVSALKLEGNNVKLCAQVEKLYVHLLYQFEQLYFYRRPAKQATASSPKGSLKRKRSLTTSLSQIIDIEDGQMMTKMSKDCSYQKTGAGYVEQPVLLASPPNDKKIKKRRGAPSGQKNAYHIFLKQECARLKTCNEPSDGQRILRMAIDAWNKMSKIEKQPYVEESKKNKEKVKEAMICYNKQQNTQDTKGEKWPNLYGDYHVTSQPEADEPLVNKAAVGVSLKMNEKAPKDTLYLMDWDAYCSLDFPTKESK
ncbi:hypothetical protein VNO77_13718 [Canavalia gladiata]|uniref:Uncharacterized protein n=1 Tax=Canavalia gladiata TaxID=3824 RepID=A0AAN9LXJ7_CANGL